MLVNPLCCLSGQGGRCNLIVWKRREFITLLGGAAAGISTLGATGARPYLNGLRAQVTEEIEVARVAD
jgi:hypothetical protein